MKEEDDSKPKSTGESVREEDIECPSCGSLSLAQDYDRGELICEECGLVIDDQYIDQGPEWRSFDMKQEEKRARTGRPQTPYGKGNGKMTSIDEDNKDSYGRSISNKKKAKMYRLRKWQRRARGDTDVNMEVLENSIKKTAERIGSDASRAEVDIISNWVIKLQDLGIIKLGGKESKEEDFGKSATIAYYMKNNGWTKKYILQKMDMEDKEDLEKTINKGIKKLRNNIPELEKQICDQDQIESIRKDAIERLAECGYLSDEVKKDLKTATKSILNHIRNVSSDINSKDPKLRTWSFNTLLRNEEICLHPDEFVSGLIYYCAKEELDQKTELTQKAIGKKLNVNPQTVSHYVDKVEEYLKTSTNRPKPYFIEDNLETYNIWHKVKRNEAEKLNSKELSNLKNELEKIDGECEWRNNKKGPLQYKPSNNGSTIIIFKKPHIQIMGSESQEEAKKDLEKMIAAFITEPDIRNIFEMNTRNIDIPLFEELKPGEIPEILKEKLDKEEIQFHSQDRLVEFNNKNILDKLNCDNLWKVVNKKDQEVKYVIKEDTGSWILYELRRFKYKSVFSLINKIWKYDCNTEINVNFLKKAVRTSRKVKPDYQIGDNHFSYVLEDHGLLIKINGSGTITVKPEKCNDSRLHIEDKKVVTDEIKWILKLANDVSKVEEGLDYLKEGNLDQAMGCFKSSANKEYPDLLEDYPCWSEPWYCLGVLYKQGVGDQGDRLEKALKCFNKAIELNKDYAEAWANKALVHLEKEEYDKANKSFQELNRFDEYGEIKNWFKREIKTCAEGKQQKLDLVRAWCDKVVGRSKEDTTSLIANHEYKRAKMYLNEAICVDSSRPEPWYWKGLIYFKEDQYDEAHRCLKNAFERGLKQKFTDDDYAKADYYMNKILEEKREKGKSLEYRSYYSEDILDIIVACKVK